MRARTLVRLGREPRPESSCHLSSLATRTRMNLPQLPSISESQKIRIGQRERERKEQLNCHFHRHNALL